MTKRLTATYTTHGRAQVATLKETPATGCVHPLYKGFFDTPTAYMAWYAQHGLLRGTDAPVVAVLLYRKHVITKQPYIGQLITCLEEQVGGILLVFCWCCCRDCLHVCAVGHLHMGICVDGLCARHLHVHQPPATPQGVLPVPIFINGVEAHTIVRDVLTTTHEQALLKQGTRKQRIVHQRVHHVLK